MTLAASISELTSPFVASDGLPPPRAFGVEIEDLDFDFEMPDRLVLATGLVALCGRIPSAADPAGLLEAAWAMPVSARIARLLRVVALTEAIDSLEVVLRCRRIECGDIEIDLPLASLLAHARESASKSGDEAIAIQLSENRQVRLRRPTGRDQRSWRNDLSRSNDAALVAVAHSLLLQEPEPASISQSDLPALAEAMEELDPLAAFRVATTCPHCGDQVSAAIDLEAEALRRLARVQRIVLREVHTLARHYGWTETETLAIPAKRRARYLQEIENEGSFAL